MRPSFFGHCITGILLIVTLVIYIINYKSLTVKEHLQFWLLWGILMGVHAILHHFEEVFHGWNPLAGRWLSYD